jgi:zinc transporter
MSEADGLIWAFDVDTSGRGTELGWDTLDGPLTDGFRWVHLELEAEDARGWLHERSGLNEIECEALLADETRPRATPMGEGLLLILRGVNLNPGADPEDMVSIRLWADEKRVITVRRRRLLALEDIQSQMRKGRGASNVGEFVAELADRLVERMAGVVGSLDEGLDAVEEDDRAAQEQRMALVDLRRQSIALRRHLAPQRDALARLSTERISWLAEHERLLLREVLDRTTRYVEDLEAARERAALTQEELSNRLAEQMNRRMYALSVVAGVFLPLSFLTGLLGINVAGIPGAETWWAFAAVSASLGVFAVGEVILFRRLGWL